MRKILLLILLLTPLILFAQTNYQKGLIVLPAGDTVRGVIDYKEWINNPSVISFKTPDENANPFDYDAVAIRYFEVTGLEHYQAYTLPISMDETNPQRIHVGRDTTKIKSTVFLKLMQRGKNLTLLSYRDKVKTRFYVVDQNGVIQELIFSRYFSVTDNSQVVTISTYKNQLTALAAIYRPDLTGRIAKTSYNLKEILKIVSEINGIKPGEIKKSVSSSTPHTRFFIGVGLSAASAKFKGHGVLGGNQFNGYPFDNFRSDISIRPKVTLGVDQLINPNIAKSILRLEVGFTQFVNTMNLTEEVVASFSRKADVSYTFTQNTLSISPQFLYNFYNASTLKFFGAAGLSLNISGYPKGNVYDKRPQDPEFSGDAQHITHQYNLDALGYSIPVFAGAVIKKKYEISMRYNFPFSSITTTYINFQMKTMSAQIDFKYLLGRK